MDIDASGETVGAYGDLGGFGLPAGGVLMSLRTGGRPGGRRGFFLVEGGVRALCASYFSLLAQRKVTKRKCTLADGRFATALVFRCLVAPVRRVILTRAALEWPSLAIPASRASFLSIL